MRVIIKYNEHGWIWKYERGETRMQGERIKKSVINLKYGVAYHLSDMVLKLLLRTALVRLLGDALVGLGSLFTEVIAMLSLAEMGVGTAITYNLYKPLAEGDEERVRQLMRLFKAAYRVIALVVLGIGLALLPWIDALVRKTDFTKSEIQLVYMLFLISTSASYLFTYKSSLLTADQKSYQLSKIYMVVNSASVVAKVALIYALRAEPMTAFLAYLAADVISKLVNGWLINRTANRHYPYLKQKAELPGREDQHEVFKNIRYTFIGTLSGKITNSTDNILISQFDGTPAVGLSTNYATLRNSMRQLLTQLSMATSGGIGNMMAQETPERCSKIMARLTFAVFLPASIVAACFWGQLSPVIGLWLGEGRMLENAEGVQLGVWVVRVCALNFLLGLVREPLWQVVRVSGLFKKDKNISLMGTGANLVVSVALGIPYGMLGVFIGTAMTHIVQIVLKLRLLYRERFKLPAGSVARMWCAMIGSFVLLSMASEWLCGFIVIDNPILQVIARIALTALIVGLCECALFSRTPEMKYFVDMLKKLVDKIKRKRRRA